MTARSLPPRPSLESLRKQAKKRAREDSLSQREAQLILAREYGFAGWKELSAEVLKRTGRGLDWAITEAERVIHDNDIAALKRLLQEFPQLIAWRDDDGASLLTFATNSFGDSGDPFREQMFTRIECAEILLDAGAVVDPDIWKSIVASRAKSLLDLFWRKNALSKKLAAFVELPRSDNVLKWHDFESLTTIDLPLTLNILAAVGDVEHLNSWLSEHANPDPKILNEALLTACRWRNKAAASVLLDRCFSLDAEMKARVEGWKGPDAFIDYFGENAEAFGAPWQTLVVSELGAAIRDNDSQSFERWLRQESWILGDPFVELQNRLLEKATFNGRGELIAHLLSLNPAIAKQTPPPRSNAIGFAFEYGKAHLIPLLTKLWPVPDDLPHAAGVGDLERVKRWFDASGKPALGDLNSHHPCNDPQGRANLHWGAPNAQQPLDVALAWACRNHHFEVARFLLDHGANINTNWSTHEPASILHECAIQGDYEAAKFLLDHGIDATIKDHRWNATAAGWAYNAAKDEKMGDLLYEAEERQLAKRPREGG